MSIVKICNGSSLGKARLRDLHQYIIDAVKTDDQRLIGGHAGGRSLEAMEAVKKLYHKENGRQFIHAVVSPTVEGYIAPEQYLEAANYIAQLFSDHQSVYAVHTDSQHLHMHIVYNSVNYKTGQKFSMSKAQLNRFRANVNGILNKFGFETICDSANLMLEQTPFLESTSFDHLEIDEALLPPIKLMSDIDVFADPVQIDPVWNPDYPTSYSQFSRYFYTGNEAYTTPRRYTSVNSHFQNPGNYVPTPQTNAAPANIPQYNSYVGTPNNTNQTLSIDVGPHLEVRAQPDTDLSYLTPILESMYRQSESVIEKAVNAGYAMSKKADAQNLPVNIHVDASPHLHVSLVEGDNTSPAFVDTTPEEEDDNYYE